MSVNPDESRDKTWPLHACKIDETEKETIKSSSDSVVEHKSVLLMPAMIAS